jgi:hypothetical protein
MPHHAVFKNYQRKIAQHFEKPADMAVSPHKGAL